MQLGSSYFFSRAPFVTTAQDWSDASLAKALFGDFFRGEFHSYSIKVHMPFATLMLLVSTSLGQIGRKTTSDTPDGTTRCSQRSARLNLSKRLLNRPWNTLPPLRIKTVNTKPVVTLDGHAFVACQYATWSLTWLLMAIMAMPLMNHCNAAYI